MHPERTVVCSPGVLRHHHHEFHITWHDFCVPYGGQPRRRRSCPTSKERCCCLAQDVNTDMQSALKELGCAPISGMKRRGYDGSVKSNGLATVRRLTLRGQVPYDDIPILRGRKYVARVS